MWKAEERVRVNAARPATNLRSPEIVTGRAGAPPRSVPSRRQAQWLRRGLDAPGGKLPLFDRGGQEVPRRLIEAAIAAGWAEPWFTNPLKPDWIVCRITEAGRAAALLHEDTGR